MGWQGFLISVMFHNLVKCSLRPEFSCQRCLHILAFIKAELATLEHTKVSKSTTTTLLDENFTRPHHQHKTKHKNYAQKTPFFRKKRQIVLAGHKNSSSGGKNDKMKAFLHTFQTPKEPFIFCTQIQKKISVPTPPPKIDMVGNFRRPAGSIMGGRFRGVHPSPRDFTFEGPFRNLARTPKGQLGGSIIWGL